ncbi:hypothetical protein [Simiduia agarivorans]|uniref:Uncharacterized protein n=1 Tax=Simiduia agarivorans (strain DSM 21679 / JCM 13881 / BCRC 17597 / SA1) TaxID=1117647 RepID=K4KK53_SIMAS|nr:hypothetical protein [Simiduia agarivorans]AFU98408.1 hypothetical protein M5M_06055 [Simiduia agarivorans SA1 = DSM 21679]
MPHQQFPLTPQLSTLSATLTEAHARIQQQHAQINPVVGINRQMRASGIAADVVTIDCLVSNKRILIILQDAKPEEASYQFCRRDADPASGYEAIALADLTVDKVYGWVVEYFG